MNGGLVCLDDSWCVLLGCTVDQTGEGAAAVRFSEFSGGLLESCLIQNNDMGVMVDDNARVACYSSLFQHNRQGAFYAGPTISKDSEVELVDNTVCENSCLDFDRYGIWSSSRRPPNLVQRDNRENW
ncbi:hypothetical protein T484DRAFT_1974017 [Baffinella frigidus]|nr:hypothetical protein T484DRAFT_1974017 [Cryptophyta sp. CCMP2293]